MNAIITQTTTASPSTPSPLPERAATALASFCNKLEQKNLGYLIPSHSAPSVEQRDYLTRRAGMLDRWLEPCGSAYALNEVNMLLASLPSRSGDEELQAARMALQAADLADIPAFALTAACAAFRQGRAGEGKWAPTSAQVYRLASSYVTPMQEERHKIRKVLAAKIVDCEPAEAAETRKAFVARMLGKLPSELAMARPASERAKYSSVETVTTEPFKTEEEAMADLAARYAGKPTTLSEPALAMIRKQMEGHR